MSFVPLMRDVVPAALVEALGLRLGRTPTGELRAECPNPAHDDENPSMSWYRLDQIPGKEGVWAFACQSCGWGTGPRRAEDAIGLIRTVRGASMADAVTILTEVVETAGTGPEVAYSPAGSSEPDLPPDLPPTTPEVVRRAAEDQDRVVRGWTAFWRDKDVELTAEDVRWSVEEWRLGIIPKVKGGYGHDFPERSPLMPNFVGAGGGEGVGKFWAVSYRHFTPEYHAGGGAVLTMEEEFLGEWEKLTRHVTDSKTYHSYGEWRDQRRRHVVVTEGQTDTLAVAAWLRDRPVDVLGLFGTGRAYSGNLAPFADRSVVLLLDAVPDARKAADGLAERLVGVARDVHIADLPEGTDACEAGRDAVLEALRSARPA